MSRGDDPNAIIAGAKAYAAEQRRAGNEGGPYVKTADAWLHQQRWRDYPQGPDQAPAPAPAPISDDVWRDRVRSWKARGGHWPWQRSLPPDDPRTKVPASILAEFGIGAPETALALRLVGTG